MLPPFVFVLNSDHAKERCVTKERRKRTTARETILMVSLAKKRKKKKREKKKEKWPRGKEQICTN